MWMNSQGVGIGPTGTSIRVGPSRRAKPRRARRASSSGLRARSAAAPKLSANFTKSGLVRSLAISRLPYLSSWMRRTLPKAPSLNTIAVSGMRWRTAVAISLAVNMKPPSPEIDTHRHVAPRILRAERGGEAPAEIVLIAGREERARLVDRKREAGGEADLRHLVDENAVLGQFGADRVEKGDLRRELGEALARSFACRSSISAWRDARLALCAGSASSRLRRIGAASPISATAGLCRRAGLVRVGIDADDLEVLVDAPLPAAGSAAACRRRAPHRPRPTGRGRAAA